MAVRAYFESILSGRRQGLDAVFVRAIASCCSLLYIVGTWLRLWLHARGLLKRHSLPATVISVGNITVGGAGKTPVVACLAARLRDSGRRVGIISRGYRRASRGVKIVSDGHTACLEWDQAGDEPYLLSQSLPGVPVIVGEDRVQAGRRAIDAFHPEVLLLDDGFQHLRLRRDIDIVVIDASCPFGNQRVFPAGPLREPRKNLGRADLLWLTRIDQSDDLAHLKGILKTVCPGGPVVESIYRPVGLRCHRSGSTMDLSAVRDARAVLLCAIANPRSFEKTAAALGVEIIRTWAFPDHHPFTAADVEAVQRAASEANATCILTTEKDGVRIPGDHSRAVPLYELIIGVQITAGEEHLEKILWSKMNTPSCPGKN